MKRLTRWRWRRTQLLLYGSLAVLLGIGFARSGQELNSGYYWLFVLPLFRLPKRSLWVGGCLLVLCFGIGWQRGTVYQYQLAAIQPYYGQHITLTATAVDDGVYGAHSQLAFTAGQLRINGRQFVGKLQVSGFGLNAVFQGDQIRASGKLYTAHGAYQGRLSFAQLAVVARHPSALADIRRRFAASMQSVLPEPLAPFAMGLLIGQRATLPPDTKQDLLMVGLSHIIAVSGYNLTIMLDASRGAAGKYSKRLAIGLAFGLMSTFLLLAGTSASIVRAAIVSTLSITAGYYGRRFKPLNLICFAAAITAIANPLYLWSDASWWLSFLAFFGVLVLAPAVIGRLRYRWQQAVILTIAAESLCAELMTLPFVLHTFGQMSLVGLPANMLVVALIPLAMLLSLIAGLAGMFAAAWAGWLAWPARLLLTYMLDTAHLLAHLPHIFLQRLDFGTPQMLGAYGLLIIIIYSLWNKTERLKRAKITERKLMQTEEFET